jgi:restriction system protein
MFFQKQGHSVEIVPPTRNNGVDVIIKKPGMSTVIRVKRQSQPVDATAVEEVREAETTEKADQAWIITNSSFTDDAIEAASTSDVKLFDRDSVIAMIGTTQIDREEFRGKYDIWRSYT